MQGKSLGRPWDVPLEGPWDVPNGAPLGSPWDVPSGRPDGRSLGSPWDVPAGTFLKKFACLVFLFSLIKVAITAYLCMPIFGIL